MRLVVKWLYRALLGNSKSNFPLLLLKISCTVVFGPHPLATEYHVSYSLSRAVVCNHLNIVDKFHINLPCGICIIPTVNPDIISPEKSFRIL